MIRCKESQISPRGIRSKEGWKNLKKSSLRSKRFQSSYCAKVRAEAIEKKGSFFPLPLPLPRHAFPVILPNFLDELARKRLLRRLQKIY